MHSRHPHESAVPTAFYRYPSQLLEISRRRVNTFSVSAIICPSLTFSPEKPGLTLDVPSDLINVADKISGR